MEHRDAILEGAARGRGAGLSPGNRFEGVRLHVLGEALDQAAREHPDGRQVPTETFAERTRTVINRVDSDDLGFHWTLNPYRGCEHGCVYCYARPTHEALGFSCGLDFETKIVVKRDAPALLRRELGRPSWRGEPIMMSGVTDPYQPIEARLRITRGCLEVMAECAQPVSLVTKNRLVTRDIDLLARLADSDAAAVAISVTTLDNRLAAAMEPRASAPADRLSAIRELSQAGVPVMVMAAPVIPGLNDRELPAILQAASEAGASCAGSVLLRLPHQVKDVFLDWLKRRRPEHAARVESLIRQARGGRLNDPRPGVRMKGEGERAAQIRRTVKVFARRFGLSCEAPRLSSGQFQRPASSADCSQMPLFE